MMVEVARIGPRGVRLRGEEPPAILDLEDDELAQAAGPVRYDLKAQVVTGELVVTGRIRAEMTFVCSRCGEPFGCEVSEPDFSLVREVEDPDARVDLTPPIREAILLAFPSHPVCRAECAGLCPFCGTNLNRGRCDCRPPDDSRWSALDGLSAE